MKTWQKKAKYGSDNLIEKRDELQGLSAGNTAESPCFRAVRMGKNNLLKSEKIL